LKTSVAKANLARRLARRYRYLGLDGCFNRPCADIGGEYSTNDDIPRVVYGVEHVELIATETLQGEQE